MIDAICESWEQASLVEQVTTQVPCRSAITIGDVDDAPRFSFVSVASPLEQVLGDRSEVRDRQGALIAVVELADRLLAGEVAAVIASPGPVDPSLDLIGDVLLPQALVSRREEVRHDNVLARFLIRQIGLEEVSSHRGAPAQLYADLAALWSLDLALCTDPAMLLTLGADRQRYVDESFNERATDRLPRALGRLHDLGVRSYPRLVIV